ncbi:MAG: dihydropteroate synthase, partial [Bacteroidota bacterium]
GRYNALDQALIQVEKMLTAGAKIIDVGGMSSRPGASIISVAEELERVIPKITSIKARFPDSIISIDTIHAKVAREAVAAGASIINDISAGSLDEAMYQTVADLGVPYILMHMKGTPKDMQHKPDYENVEQEVLDFLIREVGVLKSLGVKDIIVDPGFGFGKRIADNYKLLKAMHLFKILECPILAGISRKSMIYKYLDIAIEESLNATSVLNMVALQQGALILRVHDVNAAVETIKLWKMLAQV